MLKLNDCAGISLSDAVAVKANSCNSSMVWLPIWSRTGAELISRTVTTTVSQSLNAPSLTHTSNVYSPGPWVSEGVQVKSP